MLEAVENQLRLDEPKCTKETFERLVASGTGEKRAKEMIAAVLIEEMYYVLKNKEPFNEQRYAQRLSELRKDSSAEEDNTYEGFGIQDLLQIIEYNHGTFPEDTLQEVIRRKNEAVPALLDILKKVLENPRDTANDGNYFAHIYAAYLLAQFRVKEAYPVFVEILKLPDELPHDLFGDSICEAGSRILASLCGNELDPIKELITNSRVDKYVRSQAVEALAILALHGFLPREEVLEYYRTLLTDGAGDKNSHVMAGVVSCCNNLYPEEVMEEIRVAYQNKLVDDGYIDLAFVERTLLQEKEKVLGHYRKDVHHQFINDTIDEMQGWACFYEDSYDEEDLEDVYINTQTVVKDFKTGRNDPCPCGSGKKYKRCCGK